MTASRVYFTDFRCRGGDSQLDKLRRLLEKSDFSSIDFDGNTPPSCKRSFPRRRKRQSMRSVL